MNLLDLPLELFREILEYTVSTCPRCGSQEHGVVRSTYFHVLGLAQVSRVFEIEVFAFLEKGHFLTEAATWAIKNHIWENYHTIALARYVLRKPYEADASPWEHFPALINAVVDKVLELEGIDQNNEDVRKRYLLNLCRTACKSAIYGHRKIPPSVLGDALIAGIYLGRPALIEELLRLLKETPHLTYATSEFWGRPLLAAIRTENIPLVCQLLDIGTQDHLHDSEYANSCLSAAVRTKRAGEILSLFRWHQNGLLRKKDALHAAICYATGVGNLDIANMMLDFHQAIPHCSLGSELEDALRNACGQGLDQMVTRPLDLGVNVNPCSHFHRKERDPAYLACAAGHASTLGILITGGADLRRSLEEHELMTAAVKAGHTGVLRTLLNAGETLHLLQAFQILDQAAPRPQSAECIWYLLHHGAINVKDIIEFAFATGVPFAQIMVSAAIYGNVDFIEALARFGVPIDDGEELFYTKQDVVVPIVAAIAYRQTAMVEALEELGAQEVDPAKSFIARHFQSGLFPCDPPEPVALK